MEIQLENIETRSPKLFVAELKPETYYHILDHPVSIANRVGDLSDLYHLPEKNGDLILSKSKSRKYVSST